MLMTGGTGLTLSDSTGTGITLETTGGPIVLTGGAIGLDEAVTADLGVAITGGTSTDTLTVTSTSTIEGTITLNNTGAASTSTISLGSDNSHPKFSREIELTGEATPSTPGAGNVKAYANNAASKVHLKYVSNDGVDYATGRVTATGPNNQSVSAVAGSPVALTGMSVSLGVGTYMFRALVQLKANANASNWNLLLEFSGTSTQNYGFRWTSAAGVTAVNANITAVATALTGPATSVLGFYWAEITGEVTVSVAGSLSLSAYTGNVADTFNVFAASFIEAFPIV
jgi:hypothetical protein